MSRVQDVDFSVNLLSAILWQYEESGNLKSLLQKKQEWVNSNHSNFWRSWYRDVFNIDTANSFGLSVWGRILDIPLGVEQKPQPKKFSFGFGENHANFNNGNFGTLTQYRQALSLYQQRLVVRMRYFQITCRPTVPEINDFLKYLFGDQGSAYVIDNLDMSMTYVFGFSPSSELLYVLQNYDLLPRPSAVSISTVFFARQSFGFGEYNLNFNNGNFGG